MIDNEPGDGEVQFDREGTSTGGLWDKFPAADDPLIVGLEPADEQLDAAHGDGHEHDHEDDDTSEATPDE